MIDDEIKEKYRNTIYRLNTINRQVKNLSNSVKSLESAIDKSIVIDNRGLENDEINNVNNSLISISTNIEEIIIPSLIGKLYY